MAITKDEVVWVAHLARLDLSDAMTARMSEQLSRVLDYIAKLNELDTSNVPPLSHPGAVENVLRDDVPGASLSNAEALANAPDRAEGFFRVPRVIE